MITTIILSNHYDGGTVSFVVGSRRLDSKQEVFHVSAKGGSGSYSTERGALSRSARIGVHIGDFCNFVDGWSSDIWMLERDTKRIWLWSVFRAVFDYALGIEAL